MVVLHCYSDLTFNYNVQIQNSEDCSIRCTFITSPENATHSSGSHVVIVIVIFINNIGGKVLVKKYFGT